MLLLVVAAVGGWVVASLLRNRPLDLREHTRGAARVVEDLLTDDVPEDHIRRTEEGLQKDDKAVWYAYRYEVRLPSTVTPEELRHSLVEGLASRSVTVTADASEPVLRAALAGCEFARIEMTLPPPPPLPAERVPVLPELYPSESVPVVEAVPLPEPAAPDPAEPTAEPAPATGIPRIAIIVDDGGYGGAITDSVLALDPNLTLAILPMTPYAADTARRAVERGFEVILHMPMEPEDGGSNLLSPLTVGMTPEQIAEVTDKALADVPGAKGVNNHEGSRFTGDSAAVKAFLEVLKSRSLYFVDSRTSPLTVADSIAASLGIPVAARDVFLDNDSDEAQMRARFAELLDTARKNGSAIGICHFRTASVRVLGELLPGLREREGVELVHASQLVR